MSFYINENLFFDFYLNGIQLPLTFNNITSLLISSNIYDILPQLRIHINDNKGILNRGMLADGSILSVAIGSNTENAMENIMDFALIGVPEEERATNSNNYVIYGVMNYPKFFRQVKPFFFEGTSDNALKKIANYCGMQYEGEITVDDMVWINGTFNLGQFSHFIRNHGWSNDNSFMMSAVDLDGKLIYRDLNSLQPKYTIMNINKSEQENTFYFSDCHFINKAGLYNYSFGYETQMTEFGLTSDWDKNFSQLSYTKENSPVLNMSNDMYKNVGLIRNEFFPISVGNVHNNFQKAYYQNKRYKALNSIKAEVYFNKSTPINILDKVNLVVTDGSTKETDMSKASMWVAESKAIAISQQRYFEKFILSTTGLETDIFNTLM